MSNDFYPATDEGITSDAPTRRRVGHELEFQTMSGNHNHYVPAMIADGIATPAPILPQSDSYYGHERWRERCSEETTVHPYRCRCKERDDYPLHPTNDGGVEWIIGGSAGVLYGSPRYYEAIDLITRYAQVHKFGPFFGYAGGHVHVDNTDSDYNGVCRAYDFFHNDMIRLTRADLPNIRNYQANHTGASSLIRQKSYGTFEFRQWNGSRLAKTLHVSAAVSVGIVEAVAQNRGYENRENVLDWIAPYLKDDMQTEVDHRLSPTWRPRDTRNGRFATARQVQNAQTANHRNEWD